MRREEVWVDPSLIVFDAHNANSMTKRAYTALVQAVKETGGLTENVVAVDMRDNPEWSTPEKPYLCVSGEHRTRAAIDAGVPEVPVRLFTHEEWDEDQRSIQGVRHNWINGEPNPAKFAQLVKRLGDKYGSENVREMLKITDKAKFDKIIKMTTAGLPKDVQDEVKKAQKDGRIQTIDELSNLINQLVANYGDTVPYSFMVLDYGGNQHVWVKLGEDSRKALREVRGDLVRGKKSMDALFEKLLRHDAVAEIIDELPAVAQPDRGDIFRK